jgi:hypothetical protein
LFPTRNKVPVRSKIEIFLKFFIAVDLVILIINYLHNYLELSWISASPGRRLNNPLGGLLIALFLLGWVNPDIKIRWFSQIKTFLTGIPHRYYFFGVLFFFVIFLEGMHLFSPKYSYWDLNIEKGYGTYFSTIQLFILGVSVLIISQEKRKEPNPVPKVWEWNVFSAIFLLISLDECIGIHDKVGVEVAGTLSKWPIFTSVFVWLWVYAPLIIGVIVFFMRFFLRITEEYRTARFYFYTGLFFWIGAIIFEAIARKSSYPRYLLIAMEEGLEMIGATIFLVGVGVCIKKTRPTPIEFKENYPAKS